MTRSLVVAPQWIGDAVMAEPLLAALARRGESLTVAALPWVAPAFRAMPQVGEIVELPFAHGRLDWAKRRRVAATLARPLRHRLRAAELDQVGACCPGSRACRCGSAITAKGGGCCSIAASPIREDDRPPMVAFYGGAGRQRLRRRRAASAAARRRDAAGGARQGRARSRRLLGVRARRRVRARQALAGRALRGARPGAARGRRRDRRPARLARRSRALRIDRRCRARRLPGARRQDLAARGDGLDRRVARPGEQRLGADARRRRLRRAAGGGVRLDQPAAHAAAQSEGARPLAEGRARPRRACRASTASAASATTAA